VDPYPHIDVEETFDDIVRAHGGGAIVLKENIGKSPPFANADYVFHSEKVVAELKCLMEDNSDSPNNQSKINAVIDRFYSEEKIKTKDITEETWLAFPKELQNDIYTITTHSIQARVKKANKQIRETKDRLGLNSYSGMLIIANDGLVSMPPAAFVHAVNKCVTYNCSEIDCFIFLTANVFAMIKGASMPVLIWFPMSTEKPAKIDEVFISRLRVAWQGLVCRKTGSQPINYQAKEEDMEAFWKARNLPVEGVKP
jgi:hypothetical protein